MRRLPARRSITRPASLRILRCCETAGRLTGSSRASSPTGRPPSARRSKMARLVGSPSAVNPAVRSAVTYGKLLLTDQDVKAAEDRIISIGCGSLTFRAGHHEEEEAPPCWSEASTH